MANALTTALPLGLSFNIATTNAGQLLFITAPGGAGGVTTVFGRSGDVVAQNGDYSSSQVTNLSGVPGAAVTDALNALQAGNLSPRTVVANFNFSISAAPDSGGPNRSDAGSLVLVNSVGAVAGTINSGLFAVGDVLLMMQTGAFPGEASFVAGAGETILPNQLSNKTFNQNALIAAVQISLHNWVVIGNVALL